MMLAAPHLILPPEKPAIVRASDLKGIPSWEEMQRRDRCLREATFPFPFVPRAASNVAIGTPVDLGSGVAGASSTTLVINLINPVAAGSLICAGFGTATNTATTVSSAVDSGSNTYQSTANFKTSDPTDVTDVEMWYAYATAALIVGNTITFNIGAVAGQERIGSAIAIPGVNTVSPLDQAVAPFALATTTAPTLTSGTLAQANSVAVAYYWREEKNASFTEASGWTTVSSKVGSFWQSRFSTKIVSTTAAVTGNATWSTSAKSAELMGIFKGF